MSKIITEAKNLIGGMDSDSAPSKVGSVDYLSAFNYRATGTQQQEEEDGTNLEGTILINGNRHSGINKALGAAAFPTLRVAYGIIYNSQGFHQIEEFNYDIQIATVIFENKTNSGGVDIFPLDPQHYFNDIKLAQDKYLVLTDDFGRPYYINLQRLKAGFYGTLIQEDLLLIKGQPLKEPIVKYGDDAGRSINLLRGKLFQFRSQYEKLDNELTAWSTISKRIVPEDESTPTFGTDVTKANNIIVSVDAGNDRTKRLNIASRYDLLDWFMIKSIERLTVVNLPNAAVDVSVGIYEAYDPSTNIYSFAFYNDGLYNNINVLETDEPYDYVPMQVGSAEVINGNIIALADITEGYDRPQADVNISVSAYDPLITTPPVINDYFRITGTSDIVLLPKVFNSKHLIGITFGGLPKTGDQVVIQVRDTTNYENTIDYIYTVVSAQQDNLPAVLASVSALIPDSSVNSGGSIIFKSQISFGLSIAKILLQNAGTGESKSIHSIKLNSSYQLALAHYDEFGKYFPIITDERFVVKTPSYAQTLGLIPQINWQINSLPPTSAASAQWLISLNNTHATDLYINGAYDDSKSDSDYLVFNIKSLNKFNDTNSSSILNYEYSPGDRVTFAFSFLNSNTPIKWFNDPAIDVEVVGFDIEVDTNVTPNVTNQYLKVRKSSSLDIADINGKGVLLEIYSPSKRVVSNSDGSLDNSTTLFYEIGERISIENGDYVQKSGVIREADTYFKTRNLTDIADSNILLTFLVEDFNFSDFYKSNYTSYGRARLYDDEQGRLEKKACIRCSDVAPLDSKVNGLTKFYGARIYGENAGETSSSYGKIGKIRVRDGYLVCIQETKVGHIPLSISIVEDQVEQRQYAISDKLLNFVRYLPGNFGIGTAKESYAESQNGTIYFADPNNCLPIRDGYDGLAVISGKMTKHFREILKSAQKSGKKIIGYFDNFNNEYNLTIENEDGVVTNFPFNIIDYKFRNDYVIDPDTITILTQNHVTVTLNVDGTVSVQPEEDYVGAAGYSYSFEVDGDVIVVNECGQIIAGDVIINDFFFIDLTNQEISTLLESNSILISGINIPVVISIVGGEYSINGGTWTSADGQVINGDSVKVRQTSSSSYTTTTTATLTVGTYSDSFDVTTKAADTPNDFMFTSQFGVPLSSLRNSNIVTISGLGAPVSISIVGGEYSINGVSWVNTAGTIGNGDTVQVRQTSSESAGVTSTTSLTIGTLTRDFNVTTASGDVTLAVEGETDPSFNRFIFSAAISEELDNNLDVTFDFNYKEDGVYTNGGSITITILAGQTLRAKGNVGSYTGAVTDINTVITSVSPNPNGGKTITY